jgi:hypothetical protein
MKRTVLLSLITLFIAVAFQTGVHSACVTGSPTLNIPSTSQVKAVSGVVYLSLMGGATPKANDCGLTPSNAAATWTGWGGPLDSDNMSIGEGPGTRNLITINGVRYERGFGTHSAATFEYDLTGGNYVRFEAVAGMDDEKDHNDLAARDFAGQCGNGGTAKFTFSVDGKVLAETGVLRGVVEGGGANASGEKIAFDIPAGAKMLKIEVTDGGDGAGCDHADIADAKLILAGGTAVDAKGKLSTTWGRLKASY